MKLNLREICKAVKGDLYNNGEEINISSDKICVDSRKIETGSLFIAIKGENVDGHDFIAGVIKSGASAVVVSRDYYKNNSDGVKYICVAVDDTKQALLDTAKLCKSKIKPIVIAITGSVGKTTTKEFIYSVVSQKYITQKNEGNLNTDTGLSMTMFGLKDDTQVLVQEMGMNNFGEIDELSRTAEPDTAVITNIGTSHIEMFGSRENICKAKFEILNGMSEKTHICLNADEPLLYSQRGKTGKNEIFFGIENENADIIARNIKIDYKTGSTEFDIFDANANKCMSANIPVVGEHNVRNALAAFAVAKIHGLDFDEIQRGFNNFENGKMRQNIYSFHDITIIEDCYNASLESVTAALGVLSGIAKESGGRRIAVLSDILETGNFSDEIHRKVGQTVAAVNTDAAFIYGEKSKLTVDGIKSGGEGCCVYYFTDKKEMAKKLCDEVRKNDVVLFKASRGMMLEDVVNDFKVGRDALGTP